MEVDPTPVPAASTALPPPPPPTTDAATDAKAETEAPLPHEMPASETIYVQNINERVKTKVLKQTLRNLFRNFGPVLDVVAHANVRMRGQAFVAMDTKESAAKAIKDAQKFPLYGKAMQLSFAKTRADAVVKRKTPDELEAHKEERLKRKRISRGNNPLRKKELTKKIAAKKAQAEAAASGQAPAAAAPLAPNRKILQMPDEYLPPNKILFIQNLPDSITKEALEALFRQYPSMNEVRTIPGRKNIAFVEYEDESASSTARDALHNTKIQDMKIKITFAKK